MHNVYHKAGCYFDAYVKYDVSQGDNHFVSYLQHYLVEAELAIIVEWTNATQY